MKLVVVVPDGMCDLRYPALDNRSPAEYAHTPGLDKIIGRGKVGMAQTMYKGLPLGSLVGLLGILGYNPSAYFPVGRSIFEAHALGLQLDAADVAFRCNIVRVNHKDVLTDFTAGQINATTARDYLSELQLLPPFEIHHDLSYRNVLIYRNCPITVTDLELFEPHENMGNPIHKIMPLYRNEPYTPLVELMLNSRRNDLMLWPWSASRARAFPPTPVKMCMVTALSFLYGMADMLGAKAIIPPGTTGYLGSNLTAKVDTLLEHMADMQVGLVHCNAPDEEAHVNNLQGKVQAIEDIDRQVISPLLNYLQEKGEPYRILICPDHYTCCNDGRHRDYPVPYVVAGFGITPNHTLSTYSEVEAGRQITTLVESHQLISMLLNKKSP